MGVQAILTSDLFRLSSTLDLETQELLDKQRQISMKKEPLNADERHGLQSINETLSTLDFWQSMRDPLYQLFLKEWTARERAEWNNAVEFTPEQQRARQQLAAEIVKELREEVRLEP